MNEAQLATDPMSVALEVFRRLETAWNEADGAAFGAPTPRTPRS